MIAAVRRLWRIEDGSALADRRALWFRRVAALGRTAEAAGDIGNALAAERMLGQALGVLQLCRYVARPPLVADRLTRTKDGHVLYQLKKKWSDCSTHVVLEPKVFLQRLCALVPRPRIPLVTYHGVLAPAATWRPEIVPTPPEQVPERHPHAAPPPSNPARIRKTPRRPWHPWAELMRRVYQLEVLRCPWCHGQRKLLAFITNADVIRKILAWLRLPLDAPPLVQARDSPHVVPAW